MIYNGTEREESKMFALRFIRWVIESEATVALGPDAFALVVAVVAAEDRVGFNHPPNYYNEQIARHAGIGSVPALVRARNRAVEVGLLTYEPGAKRRPGVYFVSGFPNDLLENNQKYPNDSLEKAEGKRKESEKKARPSPPVFKYRKKKDSSGAAESACNRQLSAQMSPAEQWEALRARRAQAAAEARA
ncbi:hypothetical protein VN12_11655 [Pirellula sp. SH-Sr6A]|uniref:hypothetical protein n=1 Tax=Pirellula sp. SH-Sr6A TaxID=1632865 RepID=UPI00078C69FC|nr:hypothetical protein [Pirellula sp. SH-Sr6A]AMV32772.1 hypothetical protein VN12_11655 [Pirellula sp. SH-Sr6A]